MKAILALARREVIEKRFVFATALALSAIVPLIPLVRGMTGGSAREVREFLAVFAAWAFAAAVAAGLGASVLAGDVARGRGGFYFSRPLSSVSIWGGKLAASLGIALGAGLVIAAPTLVADGRLEPLADLAGSTGRGLLLAAGTVIVLFLASHAVATMLRSRSLLALADLVLAVAVGFLTWDALRRLSEQWANPDGLTRRAGAAGALVAGAVLLAAMHRGVERGRTDAGAAHRALSATVWPGLLAAAIALTIYSRWVIGAPPTALDSVDSATPFGSEGWIALDGVARGARARFLYDTRTGRFVRAHSRLAAASGDGRIAAWLEGETAVSGPWEVRTIHLGKPESAPANPKIMVRHPWSLFLSADGARLGILDGGTLSIYELPSGRSLVSVRICSSPHQWAVAVFVSPSTVRVFRRGPVNELPGALDLLDIDVVHRTSTLTASSLPLRAWLTNSSGDRLIGIENGRRLVTLRDGRRGAILSTLYEGPPLGQATPRFLSDGRIVLALGDGNRTWLAVFSTEGLEERRIEMGRSLPLRLGVETSPGRLPVARGAEGLELVDLDHGDRAPAPSTAGLVPITDLWWMDSATLPGSERSKLFMDGTGSALVRFDPATGERRVLLGKGRKT